MSFGQSRDQFPGLEIDPLVDGLMANVDRMIFVAEAAQPGVLHLAVELGVGTGPGQAALLLCVGHPGDG